MSSLATVIRLHKWQLDEKRRALAELQNLADRLHGEAQRLEEEIRREQALATADFEASFAYAGYAKRAMDRRQRIAESIRQVEVQIAAATEAMAEAFQELKRFELAEEERQKREKEKQRRKENAMLDETAVIGHRRRQQEESGPAEP